eukprot:m.28317 g.28317  ORF g.28317 m.28317 type:complete len:50 (-) comp11827_c0_seq1:46-195(-)
MRACVRVCVFVCVFAFPMLSLRLVFNVWPLPRCTGDLHACFKMAGVWFF